MHELRPVEQGEHKHFSCSPGARSQLTWWLRRASLPGSPRIAQHWLSEIGSTYLYGESPPRKGSQTAWLFSVPAGAAG